MELNVLLVEDTAADLTQLKRLLPDVFKSRGLDVKIDAKDSFEKGMEAVADPHMRYDLVISDTYKGATQTGNESVLGMVEEYRKGRFSAIVVYSSGARPAELEISAFVSWADKSAANDIERVVGEILDLGLPQLARELHDELEKAAGSYLWDFLEKNWEELKVNINREQLERIIRRRAALKISDLMPGNDTYKPIPSRYGLEYYIYPSFEQDHFNLGDIVRSKHDETDYRVILTPHCYLVVDANRQEPKADHVLLARTIPARDVIGDEKINNAKASEGAKQHKKLSEWARSPSALGKPAGRFWYLPKFLVLPHLYCDFLKLESVELTELQANFDRIATLTPPYAEALQECFSSFYGSVGVPDIAPESISDLLDL